MTIWITDEEKERQLQDAAHVLLDLCRASAVPSTRLEGEEAAHFLTKGTMALAVQAILMADHLRPGVERVKREAQNIDPADFLARSNGAALGVGMVIGKLEGSTAFLAVPFALASLQDGVRHSRNPR